MALPLPLKKIIYCNGFESTEIIKDKFVKLLSTYAIVGERFEDDQSHLNDTLFWNTADLTCICEPQMMIAYWRRMKIL
jgi:hypothetical protein